MDPSEPQWQRRPLPKTATPQRSLIEKAKDEIGGEPAPVVLAAVVVAQALDRLAARLIEAAAVGRHHGE